VAPAAAQSDGALRTLRRADVRASMPAHEPRSAVPALRGGELAIERVGGETLVGVLVRIDSEAAVDALRAAGARIGAIAGDVVSARMPVDAVRLLDGMHGVRAAQAARVLTLTPQTDSSMRAIQADALRSYDAGWVGTTGAGTVVAIYDTGLDLRHPDFIDDAGQTRVLGLWDQTISGAPPAGYAYGHLCTRAAIQSLIDAGSGCPQQDTNGHGTHVAGTAAGNGAAEQGRPYAGVAPEADLLVVKGGNGFFSEAQMVDGLAWLRARALELGRPMVVNVSITAQFGPHDGSRLLERAIDNLAGPGFIVVVAAGNDGQNHNTVPATVEPQYFHARRFAASVTARMTFEVPEYEPTLPCDFNSIVLTLWYETADSVEVAVVRPGGERTAAPSRSVSLDQNPNGRVYIDNASDGPDPENGDAEVTLIIDGCNGGPPAPGIWTVEVRSAARVPSGAPIDMWLLTRSIVGMLIYGRDGFDNRVLVATPGSAATAIAVGAFVTRVCWPGSTGNACYTQREAVGDLARFSAAGPARDGRVKPEIVAPGMAVMAARSANSGGSPLRLHPNGRYVAFEGTSMATPHVTGTLALLLQHAPTLDHASARAVLMRTATQDNFTTRTYGPGFGALSSDWWGAGKLDACAAVLDIAAAAIVGVRVAPAADSLPQGAHLPLKVCAPGGPASLAWTSSAPDVATVNPDGVVHAVAPGEARIVGTYGTAADTVEIAVVEAATLTVSGSSLQPAQPVLSARDTRVPLLHLRMTSDGIEATELLQLGVDVRGVDLGARLLLAHADSTGELMPSVPLVAAEEISLNGGTQTVLLHPPSPVRIPARETRDFVLLLETSGAVPNGTTFSAQLEPSVTRSVGMRSGARDRLAITAGAASFETTLLEGERALAFSANPVRRGPVHFSFRGCPQRAALHALTGALVRDLLPLVVCGATGGSATWDLTNGSGSTVAPGMYLVLFDMDGRIHREKLMVLRASGAGQEE
jgi:subtilisin family serine protease